MKRGSAIKRRNEIYVILFEEYANDSVYGAANGTEIVGPYLCHGIHSAENYVADWLRDWLAKQLPWNLRPKHRCELIEQHGVTGDLSEWVRDHATDYAVEKIIKTYFGGDVKLGAKTLRWSIKVGTFV